MTKKQKALFFTSENFTFVMLFLVVIVCFVFFVPKVASNIFPWKRQMLLNNFLHNVKLSKTISPQAFWKFREFYSPGYFTFNRNGLSKAQIDAVKNKIGIFPTQDKKDIIFLVFNSTHLYSIEALVPVSSLSEAVSLVNTHKASTLLVNFNETIFTDTKGNIYILFLKPISQMKTANGFLDYSGQDKDLVSGKYWLEVTMLDGK